MELYKYHQLIEQSHSINHANKFKESYLTNKHIDVLKKLCDEILQMLPPQPFACAFLSAMLVECARQKGITAYLAAGSLDFKGKRLFNYDPIVERQDLVKSWSGHCWVILNDTIAEISLFRTAYSEQVPTWLTKSFIESFDRQCGALIATISEMEKMSLSYTPEYIFNDQQLSGLLNTVERIISKTWNIPIDTTTSRIVCPAPGFSHPDTMLI